VSVELDDLRAPPPREGFREELWERAGQRERVVARRWRVVAFVSLAVAAGMSSVAGVLAFGTGGGSAAATEYDRTMSCPMPLQGGVPVARVSAHARYTFFNNGQNFTYVALASVDDRNGQGYGALADARHGYGFPEPRLCAPAKSVPLRPSGLPLYEVFRNGETGLGGVDTGAQCIVGARATIRVHGVIGRNDTPVSGQLALWTGAKRLRPVAFVQWMPKRVAVYLSNDCHV
jgi:hypothetical protein